MYIHMHGFEIAVYILKRSIKKYAKQVPAREVNCALNALVKQQTFSSIGTYDLQRRFLISTLASKPIHPFFILIQI